MRVLFVSSGNKEFSISPFIESQGKSLENNGVEIDYFIIKGKGIKGYYNNISKIKNHLSKNKYDLIHAHYSFCGWLAVLTFTHLPIVISYMGSDIYGKTNEKGKRNFSSYINTFISIALQPFVSRIIVKSKRLSKFILLKNKLDIIPNGIDFNRFFPIDKLVLKEKLNLKSEKKQILFLGNKNNPNKNFILLKKSIELLDTNLYELLPFNYPIKKELIPNFINASDVVVLCSYFEGSPNVLKETMACNIPVVSVDVGDANEVIGNTKNCYIVKYDPSDMAEKIKLACQAKRTNGRENINHLEINNIANKIINIYRNSIKL